MDSTQSRSAFWMIGIIVGVSLTVIGLSAGIAAIEPHAPKAWKFDHGEAARRRHSLPIRGIPIALGRQSIQLQRRSLASLRDSIAARMNDSKVAIRRCLAASTKPRFQCGASSKMQFTGPQQFERLRIARVPARRYQR